MPATNIIFISRSLTLSFIVPTRRIHYLLENETSQANRISFVLVGHLSPSYSYQYLSGDFLAFELMHVYISHTNSSRTSQNCCIDVSPVPSYEPTPGYIPSPVPAIYLKAEKPRIHIPS